MSNNEHIADFAEVGKLSFLSETRTICGAFHNFAELPHERGEETMSPPLSCHGYSWEIIMFPGGNNQAPKDETYVSLYLNVVLSESESSPHVKCAMRVGPSSLRLSGKIEPKSGGRGEHEYALRKDVLDRSKKFLDENGSLHIFVDIQVYLVKPPTWKPRKYLHLDMLRLLESKEGADAVFDVNGTKFMAHSIILSQRAPLLAELVKGADNSNIPLPGIDPDIFRVFLCFLYAEEMPEDANCKALLELADRFGCSRLKLLAESMIVEKGITADNAADLLLFADSHSCALLREAAIGYFTTNPELVLKSNGWTKVEESQALLSELMQLCFSKKRPTSAISDMSVAQLRQKLDEKGLDMDGTREMLIERLNRAQGSDESESSDIK